MDQGNSTKIDRRGKHLNLDERIILERLLNAGESIKHISEVLGRSELQYVGRKQEALLSAKRVI